MGRVAGRQAVYYWYSKSRQCRVGWIFPSKKEAQRWLENRYFRYAKYGSLEHYLATTLATSRTREVDNWKRHREGYLDVELRIGRFIYEV